MKKSTTLIGTHLTNTTPNSIVTVIIPDELIPKKCICTGSEVTQLEGFENISNFSGEGYLEPQYLTDNELVGLSKLEWSNKGLYAV